ncbi:GATA zinc finger domain-containing protein 14 [Drosophila biarmipes]|uniref:GATA zinc finger domain-containing protein 14 n=1 Tax=Drosophila biarmipes TaxID=125945 RepID=UPI0007E6AD57|nr:GATA zinc finger domain-containing protein 14 [Drosophila biarmipes]
MSLHWELKVLLVSCVFFSTSHAGGSCGPNRTHACVPTQFCSEGRSVVTNPAAYFNRQCFSFETCCEVNKIVFGKRYSGGQFVAGPYEQGANTNDHPNNAGGKTLNANSQIPSNTGVKGSTSNAHTPSNNGVQGSKTNFQTPSNNGFKGSTTHVQTPNNSIGKTLTTNNQGPKISDGKAIVHSTNNIPKTHINYNVEQTASVGGHSHGNSGKTFIGNPPTNLQNNHNYNHHTHNNNRNPSPNFGTNGGVHIGGKTVSNYNKLKPAANANISPDNTEEYLNTDSKPIGFDPLEPNFRMQ